MRRLMAMKCFETLKMVTSKRWTFILLFHWSDYPSCPISVFSKMVSHTIRTVFQLFL